MTSNKATFYGVRIAIVVFWLSVFVAVFSFPFLLSFIRKDAPKTLNILTWGAMFDAQVLQEFTRRTGIKINLSYYTTNEELLVALKATGGYGYDLVVPSDYAVQLLRKHNLLKKLDKTSLNFLPKIDPALMGYSFDENNDYSLPYTWEIFGLGYDKRYFKDGIQDVSWGVIFKQQPFKITMVNDAVEAITIAAYYLCDLWGKHHGLSLTQPQIQLVQDVLVEQKKWVEAYTDFRPDYFLVTQSCPLVVTAHSHIMRGQELAPSLDFVLPKEGAFMSIENLAIPCATKQDEHIYELINYLYTPEVMQRHFDIFATLPALKESIRILPVPDAVHDLVSLPREALQNYVHFFTPLMSDSQMQDVWVNVKAH